jgi:putative colanic acid biosynthesis glycosyltransferase WcaI
LEIQRLVKILLLNQAFYPDVVATSQHLSELAVALAECGHQVTVIAGRRAYDNPEKSFPKTEVWRGIRIIRIGSAGLGKNAKWKRAVNFASFMFFCAMRLLFLPRQDVVVTLTSPPLISFLGALLSKFRGSRFFYWVMDFNPDEAIAAGWLRADSFVAKILDAISRFSLRQAAGIIALDRFMRDRIVAKGIAPEKIIVLPPWSQDGDVRFDAAGRAAFRKSNGFENKFVVMYSGNHSPCHPLDTLLAAAKQLSSRDDIIFSFIGGGGHFPKVKQFAGEHSLSNVRCLPYQPLDRLAGSLSAADLQVVVMGNAFVGLVHPCKIYNILRIGSPLLYIGPQLSHVSEILHGLNGEFPSGSAGHGEVDNVIRHILQLKETAIPQTGERCAPFAEQFAKEALLPKLVAMLESADGLAPNSTT